MDMALRRLTSHRRIALGAVAVLAVAAALQFAGVNPAASQTLRLPAYQVDSDPGLDPESGAWDDSLAVKVPLTAQAGVYATGGGGVPTVTARAVHYNGRLYVKLEWDDKTKDESTFRVQDFADAVALEFPAKIAGSTVPAICMGQADAGVNIWQWRADSEAGLKDPVDVYAGALVDAYPSKETLFYTAREAGNPYANPEAGPVQTLVSRTFGSLTPAANQDVQGKGVYKDGRWSVVFTRAYSGADGDQATFSDGARTDMAVAVWNGSDGDRNGRKSVSQFVTLTIAATAAPGSDSNTTTVVIALVLLAVFGFGGIGLAAYGLREGRAT
jgi:hypothetical protein